MLKKRFKEYFNFTKRERNGVIVLLFILAAVISVNTYINHRNYGEIILMTDDFQHEVEDFKNSLELKKKKKFKKAKKNKIENELEATLFRFNPNTASKSELKELGFNSFQIKTLTNYRKKGGVFYKKEDLIKIYGIDDEFYQVIQDYIVIDSSVNETRKKETLSEDVKPTLTKIEINSAKMDDLTSLPGIGESYAKRIISYRNLLGGYYQKKQLLEVYGMDSVRYHQMNSLISIDTSCLAKLNINRVKFKTLLRHPYLNKYQTSSIMKYRELNGKFKNINQLKEFNLLDKTVYLKIRPYLNTDTVN